ncbi:MAG: molybdopterin-synthase adenylyltransferase MoeB [Deltaproteobacteria bacterium]|jgi:adenylyltransferase/sulfurtransferase|nr:molybdopterin-synthase adenylyltransferase MoeB [Deltaproteobacteria bacterium]
MSLTVRLPAVWRLLTGDRDVVEIQARTASEALTALAGLFPALAGRLLDRPGPRLLTAGQAAEEFDDGAEAVLTPGRFGRRLAARPEEPERPALDEAGAEKAQEAEKSQGSAGLERPFAGLSRQELLRYSRQLLLPEMGMAGQAKLRDARVLIVGVGGLGSPAALYLAAAGVGRLGLVDDDQVELSNLQRQILHGTSDLERPKTDSARARLKSLNPHVAVDVFKERLTSANALSILAGYDLVVDGSDNFPTRYLLNDAAAFLDLPLVHGSVHQFEGQAAVFWAGRGPCYRCLYPRPPKPGRAPSCGEAGVMGALPGLTGCLQAAEALKLVLGGAQTLLGRLMMFDLWLLDFLIVDVERDPQCPLCGEKPSLDSLADYELFCGLKDDRPSGAGLAPLELKARLDRGEALQIIDIREPGERALFGWTGALAICVDQLAARIGELNPALDAVVVCKAGLRSVYAMRTLRQAGYQGRLFNLLGGVAAWAREVDPSLTRY